jgi:transcriptional regulator
MTNRPLELVKGTLDVLILKTLADGPLHGYGVSRSIRERTRSDLEVEEGALYPALRRLEKRGFLESEWGVTDTGREAKFYRLTRAGEAELTSGVKAWHRYVAAMAEVLGQPTG